ncbi:MAG: oligosaccharide flippase family protein, partial [Actinomycetes bacterium]
MAESSSFRRNSAEVFATRIVVVLILMGTNVLVTRVLGTSERGVWALAVTLPLLLQQVAGLGVNQANIYFVSRGERVRFVVVNSLYLAFAIAGVLLLVMWPLRDVLLSTVLKGMPARVLLLLVALMPFSFMDLFYTSVIQGLGKFRLFNTRRIWVSVLMLVSLAIALLVFDAGLRGAVEALALTIVATGLLFLFIVVRIDGIDLRLHPALLRKTMRYGAKSYAATLAGYLSYRVDMFILAALQGPRSVAYYAIAVSLIESLWYIPDSIGVVLFPKLSALTDERAIHEFTAKVCRVTVSVTAAAALLLATLGYGAILVLFGHRYEPSLVPMLVLLPGAVSIAVYKILWRT